MYLTNNQIICITICVIVVIALIWWMKYRKETFIPDIPTLDKIRMHIAGASSTMDYSGTYLKFIVDNNITAPEYLEQSFYYGCMVLKKLGILTNENMIKLI